MSQLRSFRAYRPRPELARDVASLPYDVVSTEEARELARGNPLSFLHVVRPEIDLDSAISTHDDAVYAQGRVNLDRLIANGSLLRDPEPCLYVYEQKMGSHVQAGVVAACSVREYEQGLIKRHELTRPDKEDDRTRHVTECNANAEPVFLAYRADRRIDALVERARSRPPVYDFVASDGIRHRLWVISDPTEIGALTQLFSAIPCLYVAGGHHRTAAAVRHGELMRSKKANPESNAPYEFFLAVVFPHDQLRILDYNRVVRDLNGATPEEFIAKLDGAFVVTPATAAAPTAPRTFAMFLAGRWYRLEAKPGTFPETDPIRRLDVSILQDNVLAPLLGIADPRTDTRIDFVGGVRGIGELERRCREGWAVAFALFPTALEQLMEVADAGQVMPPKSTWFEPKLRSGLTVRLLDE